MPGVASCRGRGATETTTSTSVEARSTWLCMLLIGDIVCLERDGEFLLGSILKR